MKQLKLENQNGNNLNIKHETIVICILLKPNRNGNAFCNTIRKGTDCLTSEKDCAYE